MNNNNHAKLEKLAEKITEAGNDLVKDLERIEMDTKEFKESLGLLLSAIRTAWQS